MIKGGIYLIAFSLSLFIILAVIEYYSNFDSNTRTVLFYSYFIVVVLWIIYSIILPLLAYLRILKRISYEEAANLIGKDFPEAGDQIVSMLQLKNMRQISDQQLQLIEAGIDQKALKIKPLPFLRLINFKTNRRYLKYALIPLFIIAITWAIKPNYIEDPTKRLLEFDKEFEKQWPFSVQILNAELNAFQKEDFELKVKVVGTEWPEQLFIHFDQSRYLMRKKTGNIYHYKIKNLRKSLNFYITDGGYFKTKIYTIEVFPKAVFNAYEIEITAPTYTQIPKQSIKNTTDLNVPQGSILKYTLKTAHGKFLEWISSEVNKRIDIRNNLVTIQDTITKSKKYQLYVSNEYLNHSDSLKWTIQMIKDEYPVIDVESIEDSIDQQIKYYSGTINDDYGFSKLQMVINFKDSAIIIPVQICKRNRPQTFYHSIDFRDIKLQRGEKVNYYFEIFDNDGWNGAKSTKSADEFFRLKSKNELKDERNLQSDSLKKEMRENLAQWKDIQDRIKVLQKELLKKDILSWEDRKKIEELLKEQEVLQKKMEEFKEQNNELKKNNEDIEKNERILDKQEQLQELFEQIMDEETKAKMEELRKMLEELNKENTNEFLEEMEMSAEELEQELDRNLELFKQLEFEIRMDESIEDLKELAKEQLKLSEETKESSKKEKENLKNRQDSINKAFDEVQKELKELDSLNKSLEEPNPMNMQEQTQEEIDENQENAQEQLQENKMKKAAEEQKEAGEKMQEMAQQMQMQMEANAMQQMAEDIDNLRQILDQLIKLSFTQEDMIDQLKPIDLMDPKYNKLVRDQFAIEQKIKPVKDSLISLAKRQPAVQPFVLKEFGKIEYRLQTATDFLDENNKPNALREQQFIMTSINQLALMLDEALKNMQQMMSSMNMGQSGSPSNSSCPSPGMGKPGKNSMKQLQKQLNEQMKALEKQMKEGQQKGKRGQNGKSTSEKLARMAAEQAKIRRMMEDYRNQLLDETGKNPKEVDKIIQQMEQTEKDIVNKMISRETLKRQENIMTRLLESEKAERERERKKERESIEGKNVKRGNPIPYFKYKETKENDVNMLNTIPLDLNPYYKKKVDRYFYKFENINEDAENQ